MIKFNRPLLFVVMLSGAAAAGPGHHHHHTGPGVDVPSFNEISGLPLNNCSSSLGSCCQVLYLSAVLVSRTVGDISDKMKFKSRDRI